MTFRSWASAKAGISQSALAGRIGSPLLNPVTSSLSVSMTSVRCPRAPVYLRLYTTGTVTPSGTPRTSREVPFRSSAIFEAAISSER